MKKILLLAVLFFSIQILFATSSTNPSQSHTQGDASQTTSNSNANGIEISGTDGHGIYIGNTDMDGVHINDAFLNGFAVDNCYKGVSVESAGYSGFYVNNAERGLTVLDADYYGVLCNSDLVGVDCNTTDVNGEYGLYTPDKIYGSNLTTRTLNIYQVFSIVVRSINIPKIGKPKYSEVDYN